MKLNNWSVVKSPRGISLKPIEDKKLSSTEVCVAIVEGVLHISIHRDGVNTPVLEMQHSTKKA